MLRLCCFAARLGHVAQRPDALNPLIYKKLLFAFRMNLVALSLPNSHWFKPKERSMSMAKSNVTTTTVNNGVNVDALLGAREALEKAPEAAQFKWRTTCEWVNGTHSRSTVDSFFGLGTEQARDTSFKVEADHPKVFASEDLAPTPVELVLSGLASCLTAGVAAVAQRRGIQLHSVKATLEGDMDLAGILGIDEDTRNGFGAIRVHFDIKADASEDDIKALVAQSQKRSAVFVVTNPTNVVVSVN
jgi:uncharacterized OsmC-like protein